MGTSRADVADWLERGKSQNANWLIVATDTFSYEDYPVFIQGDNTAFYVQFDRLNQGEMTKIMEVYDYAKPLGPQLAEHRAYYLPARP